MSQTTPEHLATVVDDERWTNGDFILISADGVRFRVPSRTLFYFR